MKTMPVHCCCDPSKLLGFIPVPDEAATIAETVPVRWKDAPRHFDAGFDEVFALLEVGQISGPFLTQGYRAIKSNDMSVEELRKLEGFVEFTCTHDADTPEYIVCKERSLEDNVPGYRSPKLLLMGEIARQCGCERCKSLAPTR